MITFLRLVVWVLIVFIVGWFASDYGMNLLANWGIVPEIANLIKTGLIVFCLFMASGIKLRSLFSWTTRKNNSPGYGGHSSSTKSSWFSSFKSAVKKRLREIYNKARIKATKKNPTANKSKPASKTKGGTVKKTADTRIKFVLKYPLPVLLVFFTAITIYSLLDGYIDPQDWVWIILTITIAMTILSWWGPTATLIWKIAYFVWGTTWGKWLYLIFSAFWTTFLWSMFAEKGEMVANLLWFAMLAFPILAVWLFVKSVR